MLKIVFWLLVLLDLAAILFFFVLGLEAAKPSQTSPIVVAFYMLVIPGVILLGAIGLFLITKSSTLRLVATAIAASPLLYVAIGSMQSQMWRATYVDADGTRVHFSSDKLKELEYAILKNDVAAATSLIPQVNVNELGDGGMSLLSITLRQMEKTPDRQEIFQALLAAGADPNAGKGELPLSTAMYVSKRAGPEPFASLIKAGADLNAKGLFRDEPLYFGVVGRGVHPNLFEIALDKGIDLNQRAGKGSTILTVAVQVQNWPAALQLLQKGAEIGNLTTARGTPLRAEVESALSRTPQQEGLQELLDRLKQH